MRSYSQKKIGLSPLKVNTLLSKIRNSINRKGRYISFRENEDRRKKPTPVLFFFIFFIFKCISLTTSYYYYYAVAS